MKTIHLLVLFALWVNTHSLSAQTPDQLQLAHHPFQKLQILLAKNITNASNIPSSVSANDASAHNHLSQTWSIEEAIIALGRSAADLPEMFEHGKYVYDFFYNNDGGFGKWAATWNAIEFGVHGLNFGSYTVKSATEKLLAHQWGSISYVVLNTVGLYFTIHTNKEYLDITYETWSESKRPRDGAILLAVCATACLGIYGHFASIVTGYAAFMAST